LVGLAEDHHEAVIHLPETLGSRESFARFHRPMDFPIDDLVEIPISLGKITATARSSGFFMAQAPVNT
jgi:hypothetical protein